MLTIEIVDGMPMLVITYERLGLKNAHKKTGWQIPVHAFYEIYREKTPIFMNFLLFFLPMASADGAFRDFNSAGEILDLVQRYENSGITEDKILKKIHFKEAIKDIPVFRQYTSFNIEGEIKARYADNFAKSLVDLGHRSGYSYNVSARGCRRWAMMEAGTYVHQFT